MESVLVKRYPDALSYATSRLDGWSVGTVRLTPESSTDAEPGSMVSFVLPSSRLVDLGSFCIMGDVVAVTAPLAPGATSDDQQITFPRGSWSFIQSLSVTINGVLIDHIESYNQLHELFYTMQGGSKYATMAPLQHTRNLNLIGTDGVPGNQQLDKSDCPNVGIRQARGGRAGVAGLAAVPARAESNFLLQTTQGSFAQNALPMAWTNFLGFLKCGKFLDTGLCSNVEITVKFATDRILKKTNMSASDGTYRVQNLRAFCGVASVDDGVLFNAISARLQMAPLEIPFKKFTTFTGRPLTASGSVNFSINTPSLDAVYSMLLDPNPPADDAFAIERLPVFLKETPVVTDLDTIIEANLTSRFALGHMNVANSSGTTAVAAAPYFIRYSGSRAGPAFGNSVGSFGNAGVVMSTQLRIGGASYPSWPASIDEQYYLALQTFKNLHDDVGTYPDITYGSWWGQHSFFSYRLSYSKGLEWTSGIDTRSVNTQCTIEYVVSPPTAGNTSSFNFTPLVVAECTGVLSIGAFRSISVR